MPPPHSRAIFAREGSSTDEFLELISNPFSSAIQSDAFLASLGTSLGITFFVAIVFCLLRPYNTVVYAPRLKHADEKHAPPPLGKGVFAWVKPVVQTKEDILVEKIGLDATIFLRFTKMCRNLFLVLSIVGCGILIPVNVVGGKQFTSGHNDISTFMRMTPQFMWGEIYWALVICAYLFDIILCYFLWSNYRAITRLRRIYFDSQDYQSSLHSRTLIVTDIPRDFRTDEGIVKLTEEVRSTESIPRAAIGRNAKELPELVKEHEDAVKQLEKYLAKYLRNPDKLPIKRPTCKPSNKDRTHRGDQEVDAIDYLTDRIRELEIQIKDVRESIDKRNAMPYGFASFENISDAHTVAYSARKVHPHGSTIRLAPKPNDIIWDNLPLSKKRRKWKKISNNLWVALLTFFWIAPNALIAVFLTNLTNLGRVWHGFNVELQANPKSWAVVQGILSPAITSLVYYFLPIIFRRLSMRAGDFTKTSRERHVVHKLYAFFVFNNLIVFSLFAALWAFISTVIDLHDEGHIDVWQAMKEGDIYNKVMIALCNVSPFWITWLLQRNLGAAVDLSQIFNLAWGSFARKFTHPTPREMIEWTAPPPFDYASYYNYFLFYSTVALCFATLQPLVLPVTAFYFALDTWLKKYLLLYVFITKTESGGQFWRVLYNRFIFAAILANVIVALLVKAKGNSWKMLGCLVPLPILMLGFKWYCATTFDDAIHFYTKGPLKDPESRTLPEHKERRGDRVGVRFGNPVLYRKLMVPMVHEKAKHVLHQVYRGRLEDQSDVAAMTAYSDTFSLDNMSPNHPGKKAPSSSPFELVSEGQMDFEHHKDRPEFREEFGGEGEMYGRPLDMIRPGTPGSFTTLDRGRSSSQDSDRTRFDQETYVDGTNYPAGYHQTSAAYRHHSPSRHNYNSGYGGMTRGNSYMNGSETNLLGGAAPMGSENMPGRNQASPYGYAGTGTAGTPLSEDELGYDYFRTGRR
ncbi:DUF221-domain-containing protein [Patellaria atrata CBS 101060]|uniref:DUF221-domain-containing protein n=1 Tax=Patellaria atrata CBS 101060 TaxID=1346257 RepID=A0A9P4SI12_9PEZI|nr:DUF221-domain-containing protein [Patellaria atrata CBS 101060]